MRIVLDTGILISALITKNTPPDLLYRCWRKGVFELTTSHPQLEELERVLSYKKLERFIRKDEAMILLDGLYHSAIIVTDLPTVTLSPDPDDNKIIATALAAKADYLVSGDKRDLLALEKSENTLIVSARKMAEILNIIE